MQNIKHEFIRHCLELNILRFGSFTLKSGRISPYFFNAGLFNTGQALAKLGEYYAATLLAADIEYDMLFGPAYKGIPLVTSTAIALANQVKKNIPYAFNRKEAKDHGEGGNIVGHELFGRVVIIDDVITAGTAIREAITIIKAKKANPVAIITALDRQEQGQNQQSAILEIQQRFNIPVISIINLDDLLHYLETDNALKDYLPELLDYRKKFGTKP